MIARLLGLTAALVASPIAEAVDADVGGYMRVSTRPDFQGGDGKLGYWNLYGRLLNETPWVALDSRLNLLEAKPGSGQSWAAIHARVEGGSILNADANGGALSQMRLSQLYLLSGSSTASPWEWQLGTLHHWTGDLGLYDMRPDSLFDRTVGGAVRYRGDRINALVAVGDSGYGLDAERYNAVLTAGGRLRVRLTDRLEVGLGGEGRYEPASQGNVNAPYTTPGLDMESVLRGEVLENFLAENPDGELLFPDPVATDARSWVATGYLGFGDLGPLNWNSTYIRAERLHPDALTTETYNGASTTLYLTELTDERTMWLLGNEMNLTLRPRLLDAVWGVVLGRHTDADNTVAPSDHAREYASTVLRLQAYLRPDVHLLLENSFAIETSTNGNTYRNSVGSIFQSEDGIQDSRGLEFGDSDTRQTWQGKTGIVLNPLGPGVYVRPSIRLLYGVQVSSQHAAWGSSFVDSQNQYDDFYSDEDLLNDRHIHQVVALEAEAWF